MKKIIVISDTHIPVVAKELPKELESYLENSDYLISAGDFVSQDFLKDLEKKYNLIGVAGNMDSLEIRNYLPYKRTFEIEGVKFGLIHGRGAPQDLIEYCLKEFEGKDLDIIIFGHSHRAFKGYYKDIFFFNPGSPTDTIYAPYKSFGIIEVEDGKFKAEIKRI